MVPLNPSAKNAKTLLCAFVLSFLFPLSALAADPGYFTVTFSKIDRVQRTSANDRVELQLIASSTLATTSAVSWPVPNEIPGQLKVVRLSYLFWKTSEEHSDSILDACQQLALLAQAQPDDYELAVKIQVPDADQVVVFAADQLITYFHTAGYSLNCNLKRL